MKTKTTKPNFQKALKALAKGKNRIIYAESKTPGALLVCDGYVVLTIPQFEFDFFRESNQKLYFDHMQNIADYMEYKPEMQPVTMTTIEITFQGDNKATVFKSKSGKFLSCINSKFIELVKLTGYGDCLNYCKAINRKNPITYNDGSGCGFVLLPINMDASEILNNVLDFDY